MLRRALQLTCHQVTQGPADRYNRTVPTPRLLLCPNCSIGEKSQRCVSSRDTSWGFSSRPEPHQGDTLQEILWLPTSGQNKFIQLYLKHFFFLFEKFFHCFEVKHCVVASSSWDLRCIITVSSFSSAPLSRTYWPRSIRQKTKNKKKTLLTPLWIAFTSPSPVLSFSLNATDLRPFCSIASDTRDRAALQQLCQPQARQLARPGKDSVRVALMSDRVMSQQHGAGSRSSLRHVGPSSFLFFALRAAQFCSLLHIHSISLTRFHFYSSSNRFSDHICEHDPSP